MSDRSCRGSNRWIWRCALIAVCFQRLYATTYSQDTFQSSVVGIPLGNAQIDAAIHQSLLTANLFDLAIDRARQLHSESPTDSIDAARYLLQQAQAAAERDAQSVSKISDALTQTCQILAEYLKANPSLPHQPWLEYGFEKIRFQLVSRAIAKYLSAPTATQYRDDALENLRSILDRIEAISSRVEQLTPSPANMSREAAAKRAVELASLKNRLQLLAVDCFLARSECYPKQSSDAIAAGTLALATIDQLKQHVASDWVGQDQLELARFRSLVAANSEREAMRDIEAWLKEVHDDAILQPALALQIAISIQLGDLEKARKQVLAASMKEPSPDVALAALELSLAQASKSGKLDEKSLEIILEAKNRIALNFGDYWGRRAEALIVARGHNGSQGATQQQPSRSPTGDQSSLELLKLDVRQRIAAQDWNGAIERLEQAEAIAEKANDLPLAFSFARSAIGVAQKLPDSPSSERKYVVGWKERAVKASLKYASMPEAPRVHLAVIESLPAEGLNDLQRLCIEHLTNWPTSNVAESVHDRLLKMLLATGDLSKLCQLWSQAPSLIHDDEGLGVTALLDFQLRSRINGDDRDRISEIIEGGVRAWSSQNTRNQTNVVSFFRWITADYDHWPIDHGLNSIDKRSLSWSEGNLRLDYPLKDVAIASHQILVAAMDSKIPSDSTTIDQAVGTIVEWFEKAPLGRLGVLAAFNRSFASILHPRHKTSVDPKWQAYWGERLAKLHQLYSRQLDEASSLLAPNIAMLLQEVLEIDDMHLLLLQGESAKATQIAEARLSKSPRDLFWMFEKARCLECGGPAGLEKAVTQYRLISNGVLVGKDQWLEARLGVQRSLQRLGQKAEADKLRSLTKVIAPNPPEHWRLRLSN